MDETTLIPRSSNLTSAGILGLLALLTYVFSTIYSKSSSPRRRLPPGPKPKPIIGNLLDLPPMNAEIAPYYTKLGETYGPIVTLSVLGQNLIIVNSPEISKELLHKRSSKYSSRPTFTFSGEMAGFNRALTLCQPDDDFRQMRKFAHSHFGSDMAISKWSGTIDLETRRFLLRVLEEPTKFLPHIRHETGTVLLKVVYGYQTNADGSDELVDIVETAMTYFSEATVPGKWIVDVLPFLKYIPTWIPGIQFPRIARHYMDTIVRAEDVPYEFAKSRWSDGVSSSSLVGSSLSKGEGKALSEQQEDLLKRVALSLYAGGADTTAAAMEIFYLAMVKTPEVLARAQAEIDHVLGTRLPTIEDRAQLPYCEAVIKETLRWEPVAEIMVPHANSEDDEYDGYFIPKGSLVLSNLTAFTHDPKRYNEPYKFKPERFLGENPEMDILEMTWGYGKRVCPGRFLAASNLWLAVSRSIACFNIKAVEGEEPSCDFTVGLLRRPEPFKADITVRSPAWERVIREVGSTDAYPEGDAKYLSSH